jgi:hypothetical protein
VQAQWPPLSPDQSDRLAELAGHDPRTLSADELAERERLALWALYCGDDGDYIYADDAEDNLERDDLTDEQRDWLNAVLAAVYEEHQRRHHEREALHRAGRGEPLRGGRARRDRAERRPVVARPREHRARSSQSRARSPGRSDDPDEPDPPLGGPVEAGGLPPICPRCKSAVNVRRVSWVRGWSCRWCLFENWRRRRELDAARLLAEAERITKGAA